MSNFREGLTLLQQGAVKRSGHHPSVWSQTKKKNWKPDAFLLLIQTMSSFNDLVFWRVSKEVLLINRMYLLQLAFFTCILMGIQFLKITQEFMCCMLTGVPPQMKSSLYESSEHCLYTHCVAVHLHKVDLKITNMLSHVTGIQQHQLNLNELPFTQFIGFSQYI